MKPALAALLFALPAFGATMPVGLMGTREHGSISTSDKAGKFRWKADWTMQVSSEGGRRLMRFTETGKGYKSEYGENISWKLDGEWSLDGGMSPLSFSEEVRDEKGAVLRQDTKVFDAAGGRIRIETKKPKKDSVKRRELKAPSDVLAIAGLGTALRGLPFEPAKPFTTHLLTSDEKVYEVTLEPRGRERIPGPQGDVDCYKVELVPHLGLLSFAKAFVPKTYFWFTAAAPHFMVRYEGLESGLGTPHVVLNVTAFESLSN